MPFQKLRLARPIALSSALSLAACANSNAPVADPDGALDAIIADAVAVTAEANRTVAEIEKRAAGYATAPGADSSSAGTDPYEGNPITVNWKGPVEPLAASLADLGRLQYLAHWQPPGQSCPNCRFG